MSDHDLDTIRTMPGFLRSKAGQTLLAESAEATAEDVEALLARIADLTAEVDELRANQLPDGGEWRVEYAHRDGPGEDLGPWSVLSPPRSEIALGYCTRNECEQRRVWTGPAERVSDVLATPDPDSATQTTP